MCELLGTFNLLGVISFTQFPSILDANAGMHGYVFQIFLNQRTLYFLTTTVLRRNEMLQMISRTNKSDELLIE